MNLKGEFSILLRGEKDRRTPMKSLNEDIKTGNFKPVYLLYGEEAYLKKQYRDRITKAIFPDGDTVNYAYYEGKGINPGELIDLAERRVDIALDLGVVFEDVRDPAVDAGIIRLRVVHDPDDALIQLRQQHGEERV